MADSERSEDRDSEVPDPFVRKFEDAKGQGGTDADTRDREEPYHGVKSWLTWIKLSAEAIIAIATLGRMIYGLANGNGG
ncbi:hypothetical protein [Streptomyces sp. NPDC002530]